MHQRRAVIAMMMVGSVIALAGCTGGSAESSGRMSPPAEATADETTCTAFGDVSTITANADVGLSEGRMASQEQEGWYRLATRVLDRIPTTGDGAVSEAIVDLKDAAPAIAPGAMRPAGIGSSDWDSAYLALLDACTEAGFDLAAEAFTGG